MIEREKDLATGRKTSTETPTKLKKLQWRAPQVRTISSEKTDGKDYATREINEAMNGSAGLS